MHRQTKIIATLGPAVHSPDTINDLVGAGMDAARLNFSHGDLATHRQAAAWVREGAERQRRQVAIVQDIQGPKIRLGTFPSGGVELADDSVVRIRPGAGEGSERECFVDYGHLLEDVKVGETLLLADGLIKLQVEESGPEYLTARTLQGGWLGDHIGVAFPNTDLRVPVLTEKDRLDLEVGAELGVDYVAASFVRSAADVSHVRDHAGDDVHVIAKIELAAAYLDLDAILAEADAVMVARGDLGVQLPLERIPMVQRDIIQRANAKARISITATEMLESMIHAPRPTRAEVTDVANAVLEGTDAVMLSAETAVGEYPVRAVEVLNTICKEVEESSRDEAVQFLTSQRTNASAVAKAAVETAGNLDLKVIVAFSESGSTARLLAKYRPQAQIVAFSPEPATLRRMALYRGVQARFLERKETTDLMLAAAEKHLEKENIAEEGESVVMVAGSPPNVRASTNLMKIHVIGERRANRSKGNRR